MLLLEEGVVHVYDLTGTYEQSFGRGIIRRAKDIAVGPDGQIFVLDYPRKVCIVFDENGVKRHEFTVFRGNGSEWRFGFAIHQSGKFVVFVGVNTGTLGSLTVEMCTKDGEFYRKITLHEDEISSRELPLVAISNEGRLAVTCVMFHVRGVMRIMVIGI